MNEGFNMSKRAEIDVLHHVPLSDPLNSSYHVVDCIAWRSSVTG